MSFLYKKECTGNVFLCGPDHNNNKQMIVIVWATQPATPSKTFLLFIIYLLVLTTQLYDQGFAPEKQVRNY